MRTNIRTIAVTAVGLAVATLIVVAAGMHFQRTNGAIKPPHTQATAPPPLLSYLGVYEPTSPASYSGVNEFARLVGRRPNIVVYYSSWWEPFQLPFARAAVAHHAIPMVQVEPRDISLAAIAAGQYDRYLRAYARAVRSLRHPVIFSFGHEMNADWYGWGYRHTSPAVFVAAWRHIYKLFAAEGAGNVKWLWTVNVVPGPRVSAIKAWWPGAAYVTWVGVDGHYFQPGIRFPDLFGAVLGQVRALSRDPVLIAESGIAPFVGTGKITDLFAGAQAHGLLGVVWFDVKGHNLRVENDPAAIAAFKLAVGNYLTRDTGGRRSGAIPTPK
jgi:mannan endo-1,4-beta-mannosidase